MVRKGKESYLKEGGTYKDHVCGVGEGVKVDEFFDFSREPKECRAHDVREVAGQGLHVVARLRLEGCRHPAIGYQ